jgi:hypothetical protein
VLGETLTQRHGGDDLGQGRLRGAAQRRPDGIAERPRIGVGLLEQGGGVGLFVAASGPDVLAVEAGFADRRVQGALERQGEHGRGGVDLDREAGRRGIAQPQRASLDLTQDVDDPPILEPGLVIEEAAELLGQLRDDRLGAPGRVQPVVVDPP